MLEIFKVFFDCVVFFFVDEYCIKVLFKLVKDVIEGFVDDEDDEYEWYESFGIKFVGKKGLVLLLVR